MNTTALIIAGVVAVIGIVLVAVSELHDDPPPPRRRRRDDD